MERYSRIDEGEDVILDGTSMRTAQLTVVHVQLSSK
jgi:hypothetical protein